MKNQIMTYVEQRLEHWGAWCRHHKLPAIHYPAKTVEAHMKEMGGFLVRSPGKWLMPDNPEAEAIEAAVKQLHQQDVRLAAVLKEEYIHLGCQEFKAKQLGVSYSLYRVHLNLAKQWIAGRLSNGA